MRRKTQLVVAITFMVTVVVSFSSYIYVSQILRQQILNTRETADHLASQMAYLVNEAVPDLSSTKVNTDDQKAVRGATAYYLSIDTNLNGFVESVAGNWPTIYDAAVVDAEGKAILHSNPDLFAKPITERPDFQRLQDARFRDQLRMLYRPPTVYEVSLPLKLNGAAFGSVRLGVSTVFLKNELTARLRHALILSGIAILLSLVFGAVLVWPPSAPWSASAAASIAPPKATPNPSRIKNRAETSMAWLPRKLPTWGGGCAMPKKSSPP